MNYILFLIASSIEYFSLFILMFALFRFRLHPRLLINVMLVSFLMTQVSYFTRLNPEFGEMTTYAQFVLLILVLRVLFRVPLFHSLIMNFSGFAALFLTQSVCILFIGMVNGLKAIDLVNNIWLSSAMQVLSAVILLVVSRLIYILHLGFDFVPTSPRSDVQIQGTNAILVSIISGVIVMAAILTFILRNDIDTLVICASLTFVVTIPIFLHYTVRKDHEDAT